MRKKFGKLDKAQQAKVERAYHEIDPCAFDEIMSKAKKFAPEVVRLPGNMVEVLKALARLQGEREYQTMIRRWIAERLRQEARLARQLTKISAKGLASVLRGRTSG